MRGRGRVAAAFVAMVLGAASACGRPLPPDQLGPEAPSKDAGALEDGSPLPDAAGGAPDSAAGADGSTARDAASDAPCTPCTFDRKCCPSGETCIQNTCSKCSRLGLGCDDDGDCCADGPKLVCNITCCLPSGAPCQLNPTGCCTLCDPSSFVCQ